jgi:hypothetical protein
MFSSAAFNVKVRTFENTYEMCEYKIMCGVQLWGLDEALKAVDQIHGQLCEKY